MREDRYGLPLCSICTQACTHTVSCWVLQTALRSLSSSGLPLLLKTRGSSMSRARCRSEGLFESARLRSSSNDPPGFGVGRVGSGTVGSGGVGGVGRVVPGR